MKINLNLNDIPRMSLKRYAAGNLINIPNKKGLLALAGIVLCISGCKPTEDTSTEILPSSKYVTTTSAVALPGGRGNYVISLMGGSQYNRWVRLARYSFTAGTGSTGTVTQSFYFWNQGTFTGNASVNKVNSGFTTGGCTYTCNIRTPLGFQPNDPTWPKSSTGTYYIDVNGRVVITWPGGEFERWTISHPKTTYAKLTIHGTNYNVLHGWGFGSTASFNTGATIDQIKAAGDLTNCETWENVYDTSDIYETYPNTYLPVGRYDRCTTPTLQLHETASPSCNQYHVYLATHITPTLRKSYWQHQTAAVTCSEGGGPCISSGGGHTTALLQVIDDNGNFEGFVVGEASLNAKVYGNAVIGMGYYLKP